MRRNRTMLDRVTRLLGALLLSLALTLPALSLLPACAAPTLPLPPPTALVATPDENGFVTVTGMAREGAVVMVFNEDRDLGVIVVADDTGAYSGRIEASIGETLTIWQMVGSDTSQLLSRQVPDR
jgi:hypothetical protein